MAETLKLLKKDDFRQRHVEAWTRALRQLRPDDISSERELPMPEYYGLAIRAGIEAGWFENGAAVEMVDEMRPAEANKLGRKIWALYQEFQDAGRDPN